MRRSEIGKPRSWLLPALLYSALWGIGIVVSAFAIEPDARTGGPVLTHAQAVVFAVPYITAEVIILAMVLGVGRFPPHVARCLIALCVLGVWGLSWGGVIMHAPERVLVHFLWLAVIWLGVALLAILEVLGRVYRWIQQPYRPRAYSPLIGSPTEVERRR